MLAVLLLLDRLRFQVDGCRLNVDPNILIIKEHQCPEMFTMLHQGTDFTTDIVRSNRIMLCILFFIVSFLTFVFTVSFLYLINIPRCDSEPEDNGPRFLTYEPSSNLALERYDGLAVYNEIISEPSSNFFPDENDIEITDEITDFSECPLLQSTEESEDSVDREALTAVKKALTFKERNNLEKAQRLFQHAINLSPNHPDVLLHYGEFLESGKDYINADFFYLKAIIRGPENSRALANRRRVLPVVNKIDLEQLKRIDTKRRELIILNNRDQSLKRLKKEIYFQHIHHTVAIEGNTMTLAETRTVLETKTVIAGKSILEHNEILGIDLALRHLNKTLSEKDDITVSDILEMHRRVMGHVDPLTAGTFRTTQVFVGEHTPPAASDVEVLMEEFIEVLQHQINQLKSFQHKSYVDYMHPVQIAAFAHYKLVFIHPFLDGNGRTARLLMNLLLIKYGFPPVIIRKEDRSEYYKYLQFANEGDIRPFYRFIARATEYTLDAFLHAHGFKKTRPLKCLESSDSIEDIKDVIPL